MPKSITSRSTESSAGIALLLDTHIAIWLAQANPRLKKSVLALIEAGFDERRLCLSPISAWEIGLLVAQNKLDLHQSPRIWFDDFVQRFGVTILDITPDIAINSSFIPGKFHRDPADRMLIATAMANTAAIVTADRNILAYGHQGYVEIVAC